MPEVILVHGLWYGRGSTALLRKRLQERGFKVRTFSYSSIFRDPAETVARLLQLVPGDGKVHLAGHSLGGLIIVLALAQRTEPLRGRVVMLGTPLNGSSVARRMAAWPGVRSLLGRSRKLLTQGADLADSPVEIGMIAGVAGHGLGRLTGAIDGPSDGTVMLSETRHPALSAHLEVRAGHTSMLFSAEVAAQLAHFLDHGRFSTP